MSSTVTPGNFNLLSRAISRFLIRAEGALSTVLSVMNEHADLLKFSD